MSQFIDSTGAKPLLDRVPYDRFRVSPADPSTLRCEDVERCLKRRAEAAGGRLKVEEFAESYQGRPIYLATLGSGPRRVLLWSQMHGDEPTHTAVLLDLLSYLTQYATDPAAAGILAGCTLCVLPMLNPDGAAAGTRYNAQHIDVNRDALRLETPEGRALHRAVETLRPEFGFNLHNQNARTAVGQPPKPAVVSLMAPALDAAGTETAQIRAAKQLAVCFAEAVRPEIEGLLTRYETEYMPWSFGERVQAMGVVTVLVEAGGWPGPDPAPMVEVHFNGLLAALAAIADGGYRTADPNILDRLPRANELKLYDVVITGGKLLDVDCRAPVRADLGINHSQGQRLSMSNPPDGTIEDIGDLGTATGKVVIDASDCLVVPGRVAFQSDWSPGIPLDEARIDALLASGVTTIVGRVDLADRANAAMASPCDLPVNWCFAASGDIWKPLPETASSAEHVEQTWQACERVGLAASRGKIRRSFAADLAMLDAKSTVVEVIVAGVPVWSAGRRTGKNAGTLLSPPGENGGC